MTASAWVTAALVLVLVAAAAGWPVSRRWADRPAVRDRIVDLAERRPRRLILLAAGGFAAAGLVIGGRVAAVVLAVYAALGARAFVRQAVRRRVAAVRARSLDDLCSLAADLRAGLPPAAVTSRPGCTTPSAGMVDPRIGELSAAVWRLAERTGAPVADLVQRIEADSRASDRAARSAAAQSAGAQVTALLLAALPLGGIALGYGIGTDPLQVLLHTRLGAACAVGAVLLQGAGLLWADRLVSGPSR
jgi:tight adherence protein B